MKSYKVHILLFIICSYFFYPMYAQENEAQITGYILNPNNEPAPYSTVVLLNQDSVQMKGTLTRLDGLFILENLKPGNYLVMVRNVEFETYISAPVSILNNENIPLGNITLKTKITGLDEVVVTGTKALVEVHADKMVFNVASSVNAAGNNALELIGKAPGIVVDLDKNIVLQGKSGVQIYINGRPSRISGIDLSNMLEGMRSENIESLEIISNPSAKFDAEGTGGIINIVTKKNIKAGFNGNAVAGYSKGTYPRANLGTSLNYSGDKINFFSTLNASKDIYQDDFIQTTGRELYHLDMKSLSENTRKGYNASAGMEYTINPQHTISIDGKALLNDRDNHLENNTIITDLAGVIPSEILSAQTLDKIATGNYDMNLHYYFVPDRNSNLSADLSIGRFKSAKETYQPNKYFTPDSLLLRSVNSEYNANTDIGLVSAVLDFEKKINKITFSTGAKYSYITTDNQLDFYNIEDNIPIPDMTRSNDFTYLEKIAAAYVILDAEAGENFTFKTGLRLENTSSLGTLESEMPVNDNVVPRNYTSLFPNVGISFDDKKNNVISISVGRRINRPNYQDLNPFESKLSELSAWRGNPFLEPNYINNYQLSWSYKQKLVISNTYSVTHNYFANVFITVSDKGSVISPRNMNNVINNGLSLSYPQKVFNWWQFSSFLNYNYQSYDGDIEGTIIALKANIFNFRIQNILKLPAGITAELTFYYNSPWIWGGTVNVKQFYSLSFGIKKNFFKDRLLLQITGNDITNHNSDFYYTSNYGGMIIDGIRSFDIQRFGINLTYKFGNQQAKGAKKKSSAMDDELRRISD